MYRAKAIAPAAVLDLTEEQFEQLKEKCNQAAHWSNPPEDQKAHLALFKAEVKSHYRATQLRRCCYCSIELHASHKTFDLEHILSQKHFSKFMFELINLAAACTSCNGSKGQKHVLVARLAANPPSSIPLASDDYVLVHPHYDEWQDHLTFDSFSRIISTNGSEKGRETIRICGIHKINAARIADQFGQSGQAPVEAALRNLWTVKRKSKREAILEVLDEIASKTGLASAKIIVESLRAEE